MTTMAERYRRWYAYEKESHAAVEGSLASVPEARRSEPEFQKAVDLLAHIAAARRMWLYRFGVVAEGPTTVDELFPKDVPLEAARERLREAEELWTSYLAELDDEEVGRVFEYRAVEGERFRNRIEDLLTQLFGHSLYHRGQIASLVRRLGGQPAVTDYVFWTREAVDPAD